MAKLRDARFSSPSGFNPDGAAYLDVLMVKQLSNGACHSILFKLIFAILRHDSSEALRRRYVILSMNFFIAHSFLVGLTTTSYHFSQYALLLSYFQYCQHILDPDVPKTVMQFLLLDEQDGEDLDLHKVTNLLVR